MSEENTTDPVARELGKRFASRVFDARSKGRGYRTVEAHISESELAQLFELALERGREIERQARPRRELLDALKALLAGDRDSHGEICATDPCAMCRARDAIAKAEGR